MKITQDLFCDTVVMAIPQGKSRPVKDKVSGRYSLDVLIDATFAGLITSKSGIYIPSVMKKAAPTFTTPYPKPVQVHHEDHSDPIGRIVEARYIDFSKASGEVAHNLAKINNPLLFADQVNTLEKLHRQDGWKGLGTIRVHAQISDEAAITKILDGRFLTVSTGFRPKKVYCTICKKDVIAPLEDEQEECTHIWGKVYDRQVAYWIPDEVEEDELSYVNHPAVPLAGNFAVGKGFDDSLGEARMFIQTDAVYELQDSSPIKITDSLDGFSPFESEDEMKNKEKKEKEKDLQTPDPVPAPTPDPILAPEVPPTLEVDEYETEWVPWFKANGMEDATLSAAARKALPESAFCGPGRSYPVPDKAHCKAALARVNDPKNSQGEGKTAIRACIMRKCKALGVKVSGDEITELAPKLVDMISLCPVDSYAKLEIPEDKRLTPEQLAALPETDFAGPDRTFPIQDELHTDASLKFLTDDVDEKDSKLYILIKRVLDAKKVSFAIPPPPSPVPEPEKPIEVPPAVDEDKLALENEVKELTATIKLLERQLAGVDSVIQGLKDENAAITSEYRSILADAILVERKRIGLVGQTKENLVDKSIGYLKDALGDLQVTKPQVEVPVVENPTLRDVRKDWSADKKYQGIVEEYERMLNLKGKVVADGYLRSMKAQGFIPAEFCL